MHRPAAVKSVAGRVIKPAVEDDRLAIRSRPKPGCFWPGFDGCVGALDGSYVYVHIVGDPAPFRNRKGTLTQNVLAVVDFNMRFTYVLAGWEGFAHDGRVFASGSSTHGFGCPEGCCYCGYAGYPMNDITLVP
jgi:hypothetical protein